MLFNFYTFISFFSVVILALGFLLDFEFILPLYNFIILHIHDGLKKIIFDYIHIKKLNFLIFTFTKVFLIELFTYVLEILF